MATLAIPLGDPSGIGPEVAVKASAAWLAGNAPGEDRLLLVGHRGLFQETCRRLAIDLSPEYVEKVRAGQKQPALSLLDKSPPGFDPAKLSAGPSKEGGEAAFTWLSSAINLALRRQAAGIATAPLSKHALHLAGRDYPGQTEILEEKSKAEHAVMMLVGGGLRVALVTTHMALAEAIKLVTAERIMKTVQVVAKDLRERFAIANPRIALCGLNPHAGESGDFGRQDADVIAPCVKRFQDLGLAVTGPHPADTLFPRAAKGEFDAVVAMYHDQGMIPVKLASFGKGVNVTLGLPFVRTSPDHGTAWEIAGKGVADAGSMREAIELAFTLVRQTGKSL